MSRSQLFKERIIGIMEKSISMLDDFWASLPLAIIIGIVCIYILKKRKVITEYTLKNRYVNAVVLLVMYITIIIRMSIIARPIGSIREIDLIPFDMPGGHIYIVLYSIANIIVFLPIGILLPMIWHKMNNVKRVLLAGFCGSLFIELAQLVLQCGVCQTEDLIMNTVGAGAGYWIYRKATRVEKTQTSHNN